MSPAPRAAACVLAAACLLTFLAASGTDGTGAEAGKERGRRLLLLLESSQNMSEEIRKGDFSHANLRGARIAGEDLLSRMEGRTFSQVYQSREYLEGEGLFSAVLRGVRLYGADLTGADLHRVDLSRAVLEQAVLLGSDLRGAVLNQADLQRADLAEADLRKAGLFRANLSSASLRRARLEGARLRESSLRGADLRGARVRGADLQGADLEGAIVDAGDWLLSSGACLDPGRWSLVRIAPDTSSWRVSVSLGEGGEPVVRKNSIGVDLKPCRP
jgi:uncharacterized protein YjbI with pentapeptide repeats